MVQWVTLLPEQAAFSSRVLVQVLTPVFPLQLPDTGNRRQKVPTTHKSIRMEFFLLLALKLYRRHMSSKPVDGVSPFAKRVTKGRNDLKLLL